jgi:hypothetical protein
MTNRFEEARQLDLLALLRVRAEVLLERDEIAPEDREELVRIACPMAHRRITGPIPRPEPLED